MGKVIEKDLTEDYLLFKKGWTITSVKNNNLDKKRQNEECISFHDEDREAQIKELADWILKNAKK